MEFDSSIQVYVRRSYTAYDVISVHHDELDNGIPMVQWQFLLPVSHPNRFLPPGINLYFTVGLG